MLIHQLIALVVMIILLFILTATSDLKKVK